MANTLRQYINKLTDRCVRKFGSQYADENEDLIEVAAKNKRMLDRFDDEVEKADLTVMSVGSQGQTKEDINPIIKYRNDVAKLYADNLDALMLTPRSRYKKKENQGKNDNDKMSEYFEALKL